MYARFAFAAAALLLALGRSSSRAAVADERPGVPANFTIDAIAHVERPRELAATPNGDLLVGTLGNDVYVVSHATGSPGAPSIFAHLDDAEAAGIALDGDTLFVGTTFGIWRIPYTPGDRTARRAPERIATVRPDGGGGHSTTSVAAARDAVFAGVGSSCNACAESDPTRASIQAMAPDGRSLHARATHVRNPIALAIDPATGDLWAGVAGQDELAHGHPYEIFDDVGIRPGTVDYGWPTCYEDRRPAQPGDDCADAAVSRGVFPAYETPIGIAFYPANARGAYAFPAPWRGGAFVTLHGSWHKPLVPPLVAFVPITGAAPTKRVDWNDPNAQWKTFVRDWQRAGGRRIGRPTGIAVGPDGSLFVADDLSDTIYRIRPIVKNTSRGR